MTFCPQCKKEYGDEGRFCLECGAKLVNKQQSDGLASGISLGDKNVISGEVIGHKEDIRVSGNATIVRNEDETRKMMPCNFCGTYTLLMKGVVCRRCVAFVCEKHFDEATNQCVKCQRGMSAEDEKQYVALLREVLSDNRIDIQDRHRLDEARMHLNLSEELARQLEQKCKSSLSSEMSGPSLRDRKLIEFARLTLLEEFRVDQALSVLAPLFKRFADDPEIRRLYLLAIVEKDPEQALQLIQSIGFDDLDKSLAHAELLVRRGDCEGAVDIVRHDRVVFGADNPLLLARDAETSIEENAYALD